MDALDVSLMYESRIFNIVDTFQMRYTDTLFTEREVRSIICLDYLLPNTYSTKYQSLFVDQLEIIVC